MSTINKNRLRPTVRKARFTAVTSTYVRMRTERLDLVAVSLDDLDALYELHADPDGWRHFPQGRHANIDTTRAFVETVARSWSTDGLGYWTVRLPESPTVIGLGGVRRLTDGSWNLAYRFASAARGHGYAQEVARAGLTAARAVDAARPVVAWIDETNPGSVRVAERVGLTYQGKRHHPDGTLMLVYADRVLPPPSEAG